MSAGPVQLNWLARYVPLKPRLDEQARRSLLEVGSGYRGLGVLLDSPFVGVDVGFSAPAVPPMIAMEYDGQRLPFADGAFDTVVSMDTLEHVPPAQRGPFLDELLRASAARVLVGFPAGAEGREADRLLAQVFQARGGAAPTWLGEHDALGLPEAAEVEALFRARPAWRWEALPSVGSLPCLLLTLADALPAMAAWSDPIVQANRDALCKWIEGGTFGPSFRKVYLLERREALRPRVDLGNVATLAAALTCSACRGEGLSAEGPQLTCPRCQAAYRTDRQGVWRLRADRAPAPPPTESATFYLEPDWLNGIEWARAVSRYLHAFPATAPCRLWLQVDPAKLSLEEAAKLLEPLHSAFGEAPFPELTLSADLAERPAQRIGLPSEEGELREWSTARFRDALREGARP